MSTQGSLFTEHRSALTRTVRYCRPVLAAHGDAETSHEAAAALIASGKHAARCLEALRILEAALVPQTCMELAHGDEAQRVFLAKRLSDCRLRGWARVDEMRACRVTGRRQQVWQITSAGRRVLAEGDGRVTT